VPTVTLYPAADAWVDSINANTNYGNDNYLIVADGTRAWFRFDLSSIPSGKVITSAVLSVKPFYSGNREMNIQRATDISWSETTITYNNAPNASVVSNEIFYLNGWGLSDYYNYNVTGEVTAAMTAGGICWRVKNARDTGYNPFCWLSEKSYTATGCTKLVVTYADSGTTTGFVDVPAVAAYLSGTYAYESPPTSRAFSVTTDTNLWIYNSSSSGRDVNDTACYFNTETSNLISLGMPSGATVTSRDLRMYCHDAFSGNEYTVARLFYSASAALGSTVTTGDWDAPGCSLIGTIANSLFGTGWKIWTIPAHNTSGYTNCYFSAGSGVTDPSTAGFSSPTNTDGNYPVLRVYYDYTPSSDLTKSLSESASVTDNITKLLEISAVLIDSVSITDAIAKLLSIQALLTDNTTASDSVSKFITVLIKTLSDNINMSDPAAQTFMRYIALHLRSCVGSGT
jgi:hypothetical protein